MIAKAVEPFSWNRSHSISSAPPRRVFLLTFMIDPYLLCLDVEKNWTRCWSILANPESSQDQRKAAHSVVSDPMTGLSKVYSEDGNSLIVLSPDTSEEKAIPKLFTQHRKTIESTTGVMPALVHHSKFVSNFKKHSYNLLEGTFLYLTLFDQMLCC